MANSGRGTGSMRYVSDNALAAFIQMQSNDLRDMLLELQVRRKHAGSGCACDLVEDDDGSEAFRENGVRVRQWCGLHEWYMKQPRLETAPVTVEGGVVVKNGYCTDCGGINEHYDHCLTVKTRTAVPPPAGCEEWWHLQPYGYAPGNYTIKCPHCQVHVFHCDKRARACKPCAIALYESAQRAAVNRGPDHE